MMNHDIEPTIEQRKLLDLHIELLIEANKTTNLTRIQDRESAQVLHVEDSLVGLPEMLAAPQGRYADIGTGGGFPGIPLAIMTGRTTLLVDSVKKKVQVLDTIIDQLQLSQQITTFGGRTEELALSEPGSFAVITARALSSLPSLLELASPLLQQHGWLICYKARPDQEEVDQAQALEEKLGMSLIKTRQVLLSDRETERIIFVFEKVHEPQVTLPRRPGMAQKRPYKA